jgi:hypothetical protein
MGATPTQAVGIVLMIAAFVLFGLAFAGGGILAGVGAVVLVGLASAVSMKAKGAEPPAAASALAAKEAR